MPFSPLQDESLPEGIAGLILGGGYPELHAKALSKNTPMRKAVHDAVADGLPTIAECGGFLYLHETLCDDEGVCYPMAGVIPASAINTGKHGALRLCDAYGKGGELPPGGRTDCGA